MNALGVSDRKLKDREEYLIKTKQCLATASKELRLRRTERDEARAENQELMTLLARSMQAERVALGNNNSLGEQIAHLNEILEKVKKKKNIMALYAAEQEDIAGECPMRFTQLAALANGAISDSPYYLRAADTMVNSFNTPKEIRKFIEYCKKLFEKMNDCVKEHQDM